MSSVGGGKSLTIVRQRSAMTIWHVDGPTAETHASRDSY